MIQPNLGMADSHAIKTCWGHVESFIAIVERVSA
jgi:hypothetical protein